MNSSNLVNIKKEEIIKVHTEDKFEKIQSKSILKKILNCLENKKLLNIIKYNKKIQRRIDTNNTDYNDYSRLYSSIEIEINPIKNEYGKFINIKKENEKYFHIYFDNNKEEIKRNYINENEEIKVIKIIVDYQIKTFEDLFSDCRSIESINFKKFYRSNISNMKSMFSGCCSLKELNINNFNTDNVTDMNGMFSGCSSIKKLNLNNFNTNNVTDMSFMFYKCHSLKELYINNFNTGNVTDMNGMFTRCESLNEIDINSFNINNEITIKSMFYLCPYRLKIKIKIQYKNKIEEEFKNFEDYNKYKFEYS